MKPTERANPNDDVPPGSLAVGSIICYAGDLSDAENYRQLKAAGWLLCDGDDVAQTDQPALFAAIGTSHGSAGAGRFNLPDLRDRFVRGRNGDASAGDPDAAARKAAKPGGAEGNRVGSLQPSGTALPVSQPFFTETAGEHTHTVAHLNSETWPAWSGSTYTMARTNANSETDPAGAHSHRVTGFDATTVPVNVALYYVIKAFEPPAKDGKVPAGAMAAFGGESTTPPERWLHCDGAAYAVSRFRALNESISYNYGGDGTSVFHVPDLRGKFIRATSHGNGRDPEAAERRASQTGGAEGDATGSAQGHATAFPSGLAIEHAGAHDHNIKRVPHQYHNVAYGASGPAAKNCVVWTDATTTSQPGGGHTHSITGGDSETRPLNVYVEWLIATDNLSGAPPIGSILPVGTNTADLDQLDTLRQCGWLPCAGARLSISDPKYAALYQVIGTTYGPHDPREFSLPDLRGYFVQGAGGKSKVGTVQNQSQTGVPAVGMTTSADGTHSHSMPNVPSETHVVDVVMGKQIAENNPTESSSSTDGGHTHAIRGGDRESRPVNVYVDYVIRYR